MGVQIRRPRAVFRSDIRLAPGHPLGKRIVVREFPAASKTEAGLEIPEEAKDTLFAGTLVAAGDQAADSLYDLGVEIGDEILYAKYAGVIQEWQHLVSDGNDPKCPHDSAWDFIAKNDPRWAKVGETEGATLRECRSCGATKVGERVIVMTVDDINFDVDLQARFENGVTHRIRETDTNGQTRYVSQRVKPCADRFEYNVKGSK